MKSRTKTINRTQITALDLAYRKHGQRNGQRDDYCCCPYCTADHSIPGDNPGGVWDSVAINIDTGELWFVHAPELHGRKLLRDINS